MKKIILGSLLALPALTFAAGPCGLKGSIKERIQDCRESSGINNEFQLVVRTSEGHEVYQGLRTGVIWSADLHEGEVNYLEKNVGTICGTDRPEFGGIKGKWVLPSVHRYIQALKYGVQESLPNTQDRYYWTSTPHSFYVNSRYIFEGDKAYKADRKGNYKFSFWEVDLATAHVKCIIETID